MPKSEVAPGTLAAYGVAVLLTSSTRVLGSHVPAAPLAELRVQHVCALNRGSDVRSCQTASFAERGLSIDLLSTCGEDLALHSRPCRRGRQPSGCKVFQQRSQSHAYETAKQQQYIPFTGKLEHFNDKYRTPSTRL